MSTETTIFIGVAIYMVAMITVGLYASKKSHSVTDFMVAGRGLPIWLCAVTVMATWFGGSTIMGGAGAAYDDGMLGVIEDPWGGAMALILIGLFFARTFRRLKDHNRCGLSCGNAMAVLPKLQLLLCSCSPTLSGWRRCWSVLV